MHIDSEHLRSLRTARQWSQEQLATLSGLNLRTIQRLEAGAKISTESLRALAAVFEVPAETLLAGDTNPNAAPTPNHHAIAAMRAGVIRGLDFTGTTTREDYWWFLLPVALVIAAAEALAKSFGELPLDLALIVVLVPWAAASVRRLRDAGLNLWWMAIALAPVAGIVVLLYLLTFPSKAVEAVE